MLVTGDRLVREAAAGAAFQPLRIWQLADLRAYAAEPASWPYGLQ